MTNDEIDALIAALMNPAGSGPAWNLCHRAHNALREQREEIARLRGEVLDQTLRGNDWRSQYERAEADINHASKLYREADAALRKLREEIASLHNANSTFASSAICHMDRNEPHFCPKAPCDYCLQYQRQRAERAEAKNKLLHERHSESNKILMRLEAERDYWKERAQKWADDSDKNIAKCTHACHDAEKERDALRAEIVRLDSLAGHWAERSAYWHGHAERARRERDALRAKLDRITTAYDAYRGKGVMPAPAHYADLVIAIDEARKA